MEVKVPANLRPGLVSIGFPVYNGARYLREALDSLIAQEYQDIEIIISDNASTDESRDICREYAARDARIRLYESGRNRGPWRNFVRVYEMARGEYFMWAAHDDRRHPQYLTQCVASLDRNPGAVYCCTGVRLIDEAGHDISATFKFRSYPPIGATPRDRLMALIRSTSWLHVYSLMRTPALGETVLGKNIWGADVVLMADLSLRGEGLIVPDKLFDYRYFPEKTNESLAEGLADSEVKVSVSWSDMIADLMESVGRSPLGFLEKLRLKWIVAIELSFRNAGIGQAMHKESFAAVRRALAGGQYQRAITLASIRVLKQIAYFGERCANSVRYCGSKLKGALFTREHMPSASKRD